MILGSGIDIVEVDRIEKAIKKWGDHFTEHIFNEEEVAYAKTKKFPSQHYAARFCAKEAVFKAIGNDPTIRFKDITVYNDEFGKPQCKFKNKEYKHTIHLSLTHTKNYAAASAIITK